MPNYVAELYDKDNDMYKIIAVSDNENTLRSKCTLVEHLLKQDMLVNYIYNGTDKLIKEPFDSIHIRTMRAGEQIDTYNLYMC